MQKHLSHFKKILTDLSSIGKKVEEKTRTLVLLVSLSSSYESLVTTLLVKKNIIKMDEIAAVILHNEILRRENLASSSDGSSILIIFGGAKDGRQSKQEITMRAIQIQNKGLEQDRILSM